MILYHIHTNGVELPVGETIMVGRKENNLRRGRVNLTSSFVYKREMNDEGKEIRYFQSIRDFLSEEEYKNLDPNQRIELLESIKAFVINGSMMMRENALEEVRAKKYPKLPSRYRCMWLTDINCLEFWLRELASYRSYMVYEVQTFKKSFVSRDKLLPPPNYYYGEQLELAEKYWNPSEEDLQYANDLEYLHTGKLEIKRRII